MSRKLHVKYVKSATGYNKRQKKTIRALGFQKLYQTVTHEDTPSIRGMLDRVSHLVEVEEEE